MPGKADRQQSPGPATSGFNTSLLLIALLVVVALYLFLQSAYFYLREVEITGLVYLTPEEVRAAAQLNGPVNFWDVDESAVTHQLLLHPRIKEAHVTRQFPNRLSISIVERMPLGLIHYDQGFLELAEGGFVLQYHPYAPTHEELPFLTGIDLQATGQGLSLAGQLVAGEGLDAGLQLAELLGQGGRAQISEIHYDSGEFTVFTVNAIPVYVGQPQQLDEKTAVLLGMLEEIKSDSLEVSYVDVRVPAQPVLKLRE